MQIRSEKKKKKERREAVKKGLKGDRQNRLLSSVKINGLIELTRLSLHECERTRIGLMMHKLPMNTQNWYLPPDPFPNIQYTLLNALLTLSRPGTV